MSFAEAIKNMRIKALLSQNKLAEILHVSTGTINRWENGKTRPTITAMNNIKAFCVHNEIPYEQIEAEWLNESK